MASLPNDEMADRIVRSLKENSAELANELLDPKRSLSFSDQVWALLVVLILNLSGSSFAIAGYLTHWSPAPKHAELIGLCLLILSAMASLITITVIVLPVAQRFFESKSRSR